MVRFSLRRGREDHTTDEEIEYYQPETGQTLQRSSLHHAGGSESEDAEGREANGGGGGGSTLAGSPSMAEKFRRSSVDLGRRIADKLRSHRNSLTRLNSGLGPDFEVTATSPLRPERSRDGGDGSLRDPEGSTRSSRSAVAVASALAAVVPQQPRPPAVRGAGGGRRVPLGDMIAAAVTGGGGGGGGVLDGAGHGGSKLRSLANLFTRSSVSGDVGQQQPGNTVAGGGARARNREHVRSGSPPGGGGGVGDGGGVGRPLRQFRRRSNSSGYGSTSGSVTPSPEGTTTGMSNAQSLSSSDLVVVQPTKLLVPLEVRERLMQETAGASAAGGSTGIRPPSSSSGHLRNASLRHYLQDGAGGGSIAAAAAAAAAVLAAASVGGAVAVSDNGSDVQLPPDLANTMSGSHRAPSLVHRRAQAAAAAGAAATVATSDPRVGLPSPVPPAGSGDDGGRSARALMDYDSPYQHRRQQQSWSRPQSAAQLQDGTSQHVLYDSPYMPYRESHDARAGAGIQQQRTSVVTGSAIDGAAGGERTSAAQLLEQLTQQIAELRQIKESRCHSGRDGAAGGGTGGALASCGSDSQHQQYQQQHEQELQQRVSSGRRVGGGLAAGPPPQRSSHPPPVAAAAAGSQGQQSSPQQGHPQPQQEPTLLLLPGSQNGYHSSNQQQQQQQPYGQRPSSSQVFGRYGNSTADGSSADTPAAMLAIYEDLAGMPSAAAAAAAGGSGNGGSGGGGFAAHPISLSPETSTRTTPNGFSLANASSSGRVLRGTSRLKLPSAAAAFGVRPKTGTGSGDSTEGGGGGEAGGQRSQSASRGVSFTLSRSSGLMGFMGPFGGTSGAESAAAAAGSSKAMLGGRVSSAAAAPGSPAGGGGGNSNDLSGMVRDDSEVQSRRPWDNSSPAAAAAGELQRNPSATAPPPPPRRSATMRKLRRTVGLIRIAMRFKADGAEEFRKAMWAGGGASASSPDLDRQYGTSSGGGGLAGSDSVRSELSNMDLSPKIKRGRPRRASVDGFLRDFMLRSFHVSSSQSKQLQQPRRRSLDRESAGGSRLLLQGGSRFLEDDSDEEDNVGQSAPTREPPYEIGLPVPPAPRASFEYAAEQRLDAPYLPWSAQSTRAPSLDEAPPCAGPSNNPSHATVANRQQLPAERASDSASSSSLSVPGVRPGAAAAAAAPVGDSGSRVLNGGLPDGAGPNAPQYKSRDQPVTAASASPPPPPPHPKPLAPPPSLALPLLQLPALKTGPSVPSYTSHHQPSRFAPKSESQRSNSPAGSVITPPPSPWAASPTAETAAASPPSPPPPLAAVEASLPLPPSLQGTTSDRSLDETRDGGGGVGGPLSTSSVKATGAGSPTSRLSHDASSRTASPLHRRYKQSVLLNGGGEQQELSLELSTPNPMASDLELEDLIQAISRSSTVGGSRRVTSTGSGSQPRAAGGGNVGGGSSHRQLASGSSNSGGDGGGGGGAPTMQVYVTARSGELIFPGEQMQLEVGLQVPSELCPLEKSSTSPLISPRAQRQQLRVEGAQAPPRLSPPPAAAPSSHPGQQHRHQQHRPSDSSSSSNGPVAAAGAPDGRLASGIAARSLGELQPITEHPNSESGQADTSAAGGGGSGNRVGALDGGGGGSGKTGGSRIGGGRGGSDGGVAAFPILQRMQTSWEVPDLPLAAAAPLPQPPQAQGGGAKAAGNSGGGGGGGGGAGVGRTVQVLLSKLNALPPPLRAEIITQLSSPTEVRSLLLPPSPPAAGASPAEPPALPESFTAAAAAATTRPAPKIEVTVAGAAAAGGVSDSGQRRQAQAAAAAGGTAAAATGAAAGRAPENLARDVLSLALHTHQPHNLASPELPPELFAMATALYGTSLPYLQVAAVTAPGATTTAAAATVSTAAAADTAATMTTYDASPTAAAATASPPRHSATSSTLSGDNPFAFRVRPNRKVLQPSEAFLSGRVDSTALSAAGGGAAGSRPSPSKDPRVAAALHAAGLQLGPPPPPHGPPPPPHRSPPPPALYRPTGKNMYQPTSAEVMLAKTQGSVGAAPATMSGSCVEGSWLMPIHELVAATGGGGARERVPTLAPAVAGRERRTGSGGGSSSGMGLTSDGAFVADRWTATQNGNAGALAGRDTLTGSRTSKYGSTSGGVGGMDALLERLAEEAMRPSDPQVADLETAAASPPTATAAAAAAAGVGGASQPVAAAAAFPDAAALADELRQLYQLKEELAAMRDELVAKLEGGGAGSGLSSSGTGGTGGLQQQRHGVDGAAAAAPPALSASPSRPTGGRLDAPLPVVPPAGSAPADAAVAAGSRRGTQGGGDADGGEAPPPRSNSPARFLGSLLRSFRSPATRPSSPSQSRCASAAGVSAAASAAVTAAGLSSAGDTGAAASKISASKILPPPPAQTAEFASPARHNSHVGGASSLTATAAARPAATDSSTGAHGNSIDGTDTGGAGDGGAEALAAAALREFSPPGLPPRRLRPTDPPAAAAAAALNPAARRDELGSGGGAAAAEEIASQLKQLQRLQWQLLNLQRLQLRLEAQQQHHQVQEQEQVPTLQVQPANRYHHHHQQQQQQQQQLIQQDQMSINLQQLRQQQEELQLRHGQLKMWVEQQQQQLPLLQPWQLQLQQQRKGGATHESFGARVTGEAELLDVPTPDLTSWQPLPLPLAARAWSKFPLPTAASAAIASAEEEMRLPLPPAVQDIIPPGFTVVSNELFAPDSPNASIAAAFPGDHAASLTTAAAAAATAASRAPAPAVVLLPADCLPVGGISDDGAAEPPGHNGFSYGRGGGGSGGGALSMPPPGAAVTPDGLHLVMPAMVVVDARALSPERLSPRWVSPPLLRATAAATAAIAPAGTDGGGGLYGSVAPYGRWPRTAEQRREQLRAAAAAANGRGGSGGRGNSGGGGGSGGSGGGGDGGHGGRRPVSKALLGSHPLIFDGGGELA